MRGPTAPRGGGGNGQRTNGTNNPPRVGHHYTDAERQQQQQQYQQYQQYQQQQQRGRPIQAPLPPGRNPPADSTLARWAAESELKAAYPPTGYSDGSFQMNAGDGVDYGYVGSVESLNVDPVDSASGVPSDMVEWKTIVVEVDVSGRPVDFHHTGDGVITWSFYQQIIKNAEYAKRLPFTIEEASKYLVGGIRVIGVNNKSPFKIFSAVRYTIPRRMASDPNKGASPIGIVAPAELRSDVIDVLQPFQSSRCKGDTTFRVIRDYPLAISPSFLADFPDYTIHSLDASMTNHVTNPSVTNIASDHPIVALFRDAERLKRLWVNGQTITSKDVNDIANMARTNQTQIYFQNAFIQAAKNAIIHEEARNIRMNELFSSMQVSFYRQPRWNVDDDDDDESTSTGVRMGSPEATKERLAKTWESTSEAALYMAEHKLSHDQLVQAEIAFTLTIEISYTELPSESQYKQTLAEYAKQQQAQQPRPSAE